MKIAIGSPNDDGLQMYRLFVEKTENLKSKIIIIKYHEWYETKSGMVCNLNTDCSYVIENTPANYHVDENNNEVLNARNNIIADETNKIEAVYGFDDAYVKFKGDEILGAINEKLSNI